MKLKQGEVRIDENKILTKSICPKCNSYLILCNGKYGTFSYCSKICGFKKTLHKKLSRAERMKKKFPVNKELNKIRLKTERESRKNVTFKKVVVSLE